MAQIAYHKHSDLEIHITYSQVPCIACGKSPTILIWDKRYSGFRGQCSSCKYNWPES